MGKQKGIRVTYTSGATKTVYLTNITEGRSQDPRDGPKDIHVVSIEEGEF